MDQDSISRDISILSKVLFDNVVTLLLREVFKLEAIDVDGKGDAGSDMRSFQNEKNHQVWATAIQKTIQASGWKKKAREDAQKAVDELGARFYYFITSKNHQSKDLINLEQEISLELGIGAKCFGAKEIAGFLCDYGLLREYAEITNWDLNIDPRKRPDTPEILLHAFVSLDRDRKQLQHAVYDDAILISIYEYGSSCQPEEVVASAAKLLGLTNGRNEILTSRLESLRTRGKIESAEDGAVKLANACRNNLQISTGAYAKELETLASSQAQLLNDKGYVAFGPEESEKAGVFLTRMFVQNQFKIAERNYLPLAKIGLADALGDPRQELEQLLRGMKVKPKDVEDVVRELVEAGSDLPLIKKLATAVTYVAAEGRNVAAACRTLGANSWNEVVAIVDSSVAIPFLCTSLFGYSSGRFSRGAVAGVNGLKELGTRLVIPNVYLNEISFHLLRALNVPEGDEFSKAAELSQNGFVSHYFWMKNRKIECPASLREFVLSIAPKAKNVNGDRRQSARLIMPNVQEQLLTYGIQFEHLTQFATGSGLYHSFKQEIEQSFDHYFQGHTKRKPHRLINHDAFVLAHQRKRKTQDSEARMCLTWDKSVIHVANELGDCGWVITPNEAADLTVAANVSGRQLTSLAHAIAKVQVTPNHLGAKVLDRVSAIASSKSQDWQFQNELRELFQRVTKNAFDHPNAEEWADEQIEAFVHEHGDIDDSEIEDLGD